MGARDETATAGGPERLAAGTAFADLSARRTIAVRGADASGWLNDLISVDIAELSTGRARRSVLMSPTGAVLASFTVAVVEDGLLLIQEPAEPKAIDELLSPYVLSSDVRLDDRTGAYAILAFPGRDHAPVAAGAVSSAPSCLGAGADLIAAAEDRERIAALLSNGFGTATDADVEAWRVAAGVPRVGVDSTDGDLPQECGLEDTVSFSKGCFLGQEAVAKVRNLGHPRRLLLPLRAEDPVSRGDGVVAHGEDVGIVTSASVVGGKCLVLARVRWERREEPLRTAGGTHLHPRRAGDLPSPTG